MNELLANSSAQSEQVNIILLIGIAIFAGTVGAKVIQKLHIPQIVGYIVIGIILGPLLEIISHDMVQDLRPLSLFALGIIGFMIGGELRSDVFKKYGRQFFIILFSQGVGAFLLVAIITSISMQLLRFDMSTSVAIGLVLRLLPRLQRRRRP